MISPGFSLPYYKYGETRDAKACLELVREKCQIIIPGNHDLHAAGKIPEHSDVFDFPANWYELDDQGRRELAGEELMACIQMIWNTGTSPKILSSFVGCRNMKSWRPRYEYFSEPLRRS